METTYKLGSLFDGSGGFPLAGSLCGITPVWAAEIEPYPIAVTTSRFPHMRHLGDISKINGAEVEPVDIITFGSPCQDLSVAGKRAGLKHTENGDDETTRSGLFMEAVRIIKEMRDATNGTYPRFALWENVPGAFSSNKGEDFRIVLEELIKIVEPGAVMPAVPQKGWAYADSYCGDGWSLAYRVFDAQYWGVPQRRRRIYLVADFRGERAREVLFEREGLRGYFAESGTPRQGTASDAERGVGADDCEGNRVNILNPHDSQGNQVVNGVGHHIFPCLRGCGGAGYQAGYVLVRTDDAPAYTMQDRAGKPGGGKGFLIQKDRATSLRTGNYQYVFQPTAYSFDPLGSNSMKSKNPHSGCRQVDVARTIDTTDPNPSKNQGGIAVVESIVLDDQGGQQISVREDGKSPTLRAEMHGNVPCVMEAAGFCPEESAKTRGVGYAEEQAPTLRAGAVPAVVYDARGNGDGCVCNTVTGDHNNRITDYTSCVVEPVAYNGENITSPLNKTDPHPGDPCHTLGTDSRNYVVFCCVDGDKIGKAERAGGSGLGIRDGDKMYTLTAKDAGQHAVAYSMETFHCQCEEEKTTTLKARDYKDPGIVCYAEEEPISIDRAFFNQGANAQYEPQYYEDGTVPTLVARGPSAVAHGVDCRNLTENAELFPTLCAKSNGGQSLNYSGAVRVRYIVRRLTPTECARLQGFADRWGDIVEKTEFSDEEYLFWLEVRNTHAAINGKAVKDYTKQQMLNWYNKLQTDSSEYKMWGNGIALPTALYCMQGISEVLHG